MFKYLKKLSLLLLISFSTLFFGCKTTNSIYNDEISPEAPYYLEDEFSFNEDISEPSKYIFIRLYNPDYTNPFYIANLLQGGINLTEISEYHFSHAAINFSLSDDFYGLTSGGYYQLARESCLNPKENKYMKHCDPIDSEQITLALKVNEEEYINLQKEIDEYSKNHKIKYNVGKNFQNAFFALDRRFFTNKNKRAFGYADYPYSKKDQKKDNDKNYNETQFVCSTFLAYILYQNVDYIHDYFVENNINYRYINVTDLLFLPNISPLFYSTWENYQTAAENFVNKNPEFSAYLNK